ncbi:MAG: Wzz/FepE/Etk N-terminal domain-containing protein [Clostridium sp.]
MELKEYFQILKKQLVLIISLPLILALIALIVSIFLINPVYKSEISVILGNDSNVTAEVKQAEYNDVLMYQKMTKTYSELTKSRRVAEDIISKLNLDKSLDAVSNMITVTPKADTEFFTLSVSSTDPNEATDIVNQAAKSLKKVGEEIRGKDNVFLVDEAIVPKNPISPNIGLNTVLAAFVGFMIAVGIAFLLDFMDDTVKSEDELAEILGASVIGSVPLFDK